MSATVRARPTGNAKAYEAHLQGMFARDCPATRSSSATYRLSEIATDHSRLETVLTL